MFDNHKECMGNNIFIGNYDSLLMFGTQIQNEIISCSKMISHILFESNLEFSASLDDILCELEMLTLHLKNTKRFPLLHKKKVLKKSYIDKLINLLSFLDEVKLMLNLQQKDLLKEISILKSLKNSINRCSEELVYCIEKCKAMNCKNSLLNDKEKFDLIRDEECSHWFNMLEKRIESLSVSQNACFQYSIQTELLISNDSVLVDNILELLNNIIPTWQKQVALLIKIEAERKHIVNDAEILKVVSRYLNCVVADNENLNSELLTIDIKTILNVNSDLKNALCTTKSIESKNIELRQRLKTNT